MRMVKNKLLLLLLVILGTTARAQGYWKLDSNVDDYTMEKSYILIHRLNNDIDAIFYPEDGALKVFKDYGERAYMRQAIDAVVDNDGRINDNVTTIYCRLINTASDYEEFVLEDYKIKFKGADEDGKIGVNGGFYSYFYVLFKPEQLKKANFVSFRYYDTVSDKVVTKRISLAGFTKCYNLIK